MSAKGLSSRAIIGEFYARLEAKTGMEWIDDLAMLFTSDQESETYKWLGMSPAMREWIGGRQAKGFRENGVTIVNKNFEATLEVLVEELRRDKSGQILVRVREMADRANTHWASLLSTLILAAESTVCYDGQYFFDTDHAEGQSGTQDNDRTMAAATGTAPTVPEMQQGILTCVQAILGFKDDQGEPMNEAAQKFRVMVPTIFWGTAESAVNNPIIDAGAVNVLPNLRGRVDLTVTSNPRLTWTDKIAVFRADGNVKPLIRQEEKRLELKAVAEGSELEFNENKHRYGVDASRNVGFGYWQHGCLMTFT